MALRTRYLRRRGRKATCPYTEHGTGVYARMFIRGDEVHTRGGAVSFGRDRERRALECSARGAENHRHERRNLRSHHPCMQMPWPVRDASLPDLSLSSRPDYLRSLSAQAGELLIVAYGPPARLQPAQTFIGPPRLFYSR